VLSGQTRTFRLKHAKADDIAQVLGQMLPDAPAAAAGSRRGRQAMDSTVRVAPLPAANAVVVQGPPAKLTLAEELIGTFDTAEASGAAVIQIVELKNAEARSLAESINQALGAKAGKGTPPTDLVTVTPESNSNSVLIRGPAARVAETIAMVRKLDSDATASDVQVRVYPLTNSDAGELAKSVEKLFVDLAKRMPKNRRDAGVPPFSVTADARTNSLVVSTTGGYFTIVEQLLQNLDRAPERIEADAQYVWLENADAFDVASKLQEMYRDRRGADKPVIEADSFSNAITLIAKDADLKAMETIIAKLDAAARDNNIQVRVIPMSKMSADKMAEVLRRVYGQMTTSKIVITDGQPNPRFREPTSVESGNLRHEFSPTTQGADSTSAPADSGKLFNPETPAVTISVDKRSNSLIVSATRRELERIQSLIDQLAETAEEVEAEYRVFKITQADPASVANSLEELFNPKVARQPAPAQPAQRGQRAQPQPQPPAPPPVITVVADARTRSVIVRAKTMDFEIIEPLIRHLDQVSTVVSEVRVFPLKNTDATETAASLRELFRMSSSQTPAPNQRQQPQGRGTRATAQQQRAEVVRQVIELRRKDGVAQVDVTTMVSISANRQANSVVVTAPADAMEVITSLIEELDQSAAQSTATTVWMCPLKHAQAPAVATALSQAFAPPRGRKLETGEGVTVVAEPTSNTVIVTANAENLKKVQDLIARLDTETDQATGVYILALSSGDASEIASMIQSLYNQQLSAARRDKKSVPPLAVSADTRANAVVLATSKEMYEQVRQWVGEVEKMKPARGTLRVLTVEYADPAEVQKAIDQLFGPQGAAGSKGGAGRSGGRNPAPNPTPGRGGRVETTLLANQKAIMVSASDEDFQAIQQLLATLDEAAKGTQREVRVFTLVNASNTLVANALGSMYRQVTRGAQPQDQVTVTALNQTTAVVVSAPKNRMEEVSHLIEQLDRKEVAAQVEFRIYPLTHAQPTKILPALRQMLQQVTRARPGETIDVQADERTRSLIVTARGTVFDEVAKVIAVLDKAPAYEKAEVLILPLKKADAAQLAAVLTEMLRPSEGNQVTPEAKALQEQVRLLNVRSALQDRIPELDLTKPIKIQADSARPQGSNALIVTSTPDNLKALAAIVEVLDTVPISEGVKVRLLHLSNADSTSVAQVLREIFTQGRQLAGKPGTSVAGKAEPDSSSGKALVNVLNVSADPRTNTVVLSGLEESLALAELIVKDLDRQEGQFVTDVRAFKLKNAAADRMAPILRAVFAEGAAQPGANGLRAQVTRLRTGRKRELLSELPRAREALTIQADADTNILLIAARSDIMPLIADVIATMDIPGAGSLNTVRIYPLENADATRISQVLQSLYAGPNAKLVRDEDKPTVAVDARTNALVVSASGKTFLLL
ncbi:MAG TPA: secretin N-terminal domain-containing protein, partial [Phycisphaerae bacterium]|nr:secretin N-terminal domain-containing protein [Phycisphaerae bacterium]